MMKQLRPLLFIAIAANLLSILLFMNASSQPGGSGALMGFIVLWMPAIWITAFIAALIIVISYRKHLFVNRQWQTPILFLFCTPIPLLACYCIVCPKPKTVRSGSDYRPINGKIYKTEWWHYTDNLGQKYAEKHFIADSLDEIKNGENAFQKNSTWTYFTHNGDTLKVEKYRDDKLISSKPYAEE